MDTGSAFSPEHLVIPSSNRAVSERTLLITDIGQFWAVPILGANSGVADTVIVFDADSGRQISDPAIVRELSERDSNLRSLTWVAGTSELTAISALNDAALRTELDNIAAVPIADDWSDYRPSRPQDFVGRDATLEEITRYLLDVSERRLATRLLAIKAPSGWGKSSFLVKLRSTCQSPRLRDRVFLYAVDCRTAASSRYPELALKRCFEDASANGFIKSAPPSIGSSGQPFSAPECQDVLDELRKERKCIVLFFDQFEEITTKQQLSDLFNQVKYMCSAIESAGENVVLGFSWKTDGTIPTDHPAYHVWHSFSDRRREFELPLFSKSETSQLLSRLSKNLNQPIEVWLRKLLAEHSQGYPWLLKKLCVHVFRVLQSKPARQRELFERALDVEALFRKDLSDLDAGQTACLERVAKESPADNFSITEQFGEPVVSSLLHRRLVIRNAGKLVVYWDIFRDYVLFKQVPAIPTRYVPVSSPQTAKRLLLELSSGNFSSLSTLERRLRLNKGTLDNVSRDLVMMGACRYDRKNGKVGLIHPDELSTLRAMSLFFSNHVFSRALSEEFGVGFRGVSAESVNDALFPLFDAASFSSKTIRVSTARWLAWQQVLGFIAIDGEGSITHSSKPKQLRFFDDLQTEQRAHRGNFTFKGEAPPLRVSALLRKIHLGGYVPVKEDRNALMVLRSLRIIPSTNQAVLKAPPEGLDSDLWLALTAMRQKTLQEASRILEADGGATALEVGEVVVAITGHELSDASKRRYGAGLLTWAHWASELIKQFRTRPPAIRAPLI
ncbi:hypothetical protein ACO0J1_01665 [Stenotrophomonas acidaminiphila]|uniref:nSTAND1 domain-containing NTPase n=1 Tax=Stenotrophomonas acidaminiphila TaxID=128780 RepID=UPI003BF0435A